MSDVHLRITNLDEMEQFAQKLAFFLSEKPGVIFLNGNLGAGKTTLTKMIASALGIKEIVTSPTFNIFKRYQGYVKYLNHFDLYRIKDDVYEQGFEDYWFSNDISIIEWATYLPEEYQKIAILKLEIDIESDNTRLITLNGEKQLVLKIKEICHEFIY